MEASDLKSEPKVYLNGISLPPTENSMYPTYRGRRIRSKALVQFIKDVHYWTLAHRLTVLSAREVCQGWVRQGYYLKVSAQVCFNRQKLFNQEGQPKKLDASNRLKALHDSIASTIICIDDSYFWSVSIEKVISTGQEGVDVVIEPIQCRRSDGWLI